MATFVTVHASMPQVSVDIDFTNDPADTARTWESVSSRLREIHLRVYRTSEIDEFQVGSLTVVLSNSDRELEPNNVDSSFYPNVRPRRPIRYQARWNSITYDRFNGFTQSHSVEWPGQVDAITTIRAADFGMLLNRDQVTLNGYPRETVDARIGRVLDAIGVPAASRVLDTSDRIVEAVPELEEDGSVQPVTVGALVHCQDAARSDGGYLYVGRDGIIVFHNRYHRHDILSAPAATFGDANDGTEIPYRPDLVGASDDARLWNRATVLTAGGVREEANDTVSQARYWASRRDDFQSVLAYQFSAASLAAQYVWRYAAEEPELRFPRLNVQVVNRSGMDIAAILSADVGTRFEVVRRPPS
jgi:hypothetical protein